MLVEMKDDGNRRQALRELDSTTRLDDILRKSLEPNYEVPA